MYSSILVPVALAHEEQLGRALKTAADLSRHYGASVYLVGVTSSTPSEVAHSPEEFEQKLKAFAERQSEALGASFTAVSVTTPDPARELDHVLDEQIHELGVDLVIMASHVPGFQDYVFHSNAGYLASHTDVSVFVVR